MERVSSFFNEKLLFYLAAAMLLQIFHCCTGSALMGLNFFSAALVISFIGASSNGVVIGDGKLLWQNFNNLVEKLTAKYILFTIS